MGHLYRFCYCVEGERHSSERKAFLQFCYSPLNIGSRILLFVHPLSSSLCQEVNMSDPLNTSPISHSLSPCIKSVSCYTETAPLHPLLLCTRKGKQIKPRTRTAACGRAGCAGAAAVNFFSGLSGKRKCRMRAASSSRPPGYALQSAARSGTPVVSHKPHRNRDLKNLL